MRSPSNQKVKVSEICEFIRGIAFTPSDIVKPGAPGAIACFRTKNVQVELDLNDLLYLPREFIPNNRQYIQDGDILISNANSKEIVGKCCFVEKLGFPATLGGFITAIRADKSRIIPRYLFFWMSSSHTQTVFRRLARQTTNIANLPMSDVGRLEFVLPPLAEQERIVRLLDEAETLRRLRARADARTADLIPAIFHEMFGDPATNEKGWPKYQAHSLVSKSRPGVKCGPFGSALKKHEYSAAGIPVWGIDNVAPNVFSETNSLFIPQQKYQELTNYSVEDGDILISRAGTVGRMCVARPEQSPSIIGTNLMRLSLDLSVIAPEYFTVLCTYFPASVGQLRANADATAYSFVNTKTLLAITVPLPPLSLQREFVARVAEVRAMEEKQAASNTWLDALFDSMLARAFAGEL